MLIISIAPSIPDDSTADKKLSKFLLASSDEIEQKNATISEILRPLPKYNPMVITPHSGASQNLDIGLHWHPLRLFKLFFNWETMALIVKETNFYAFQTNIPSNPWISLLIPELYHFFGCLLKLALYKHPPRAYCWSDSGVLAKTPLSKNRFESILRNIHFKDRGLNPTADPWWSKIEPIGSILRQVSQKYWRPSTNLTINEIMVKFEGRSTQKITIPDKSIPTGFKLFGLGDSGYILN
jgi:hypothetical protein